MINEVNHGYYISFIWIIVLGVLLNGFVKLKSIVFLIALILSFFIIRIKNKKEKKPLEMTEEIASWTNTLITTDNQDEKNRCYLELYDRLRSDSLSGKKNKDHTVLLNILKKYEPKLPLPCNSSKNNNYDISISFLKMT
tara:strand:+ start:24549 stop:24965 length:417 start_codon:yes stop_codon:yes gene_type:complete